MTAPFNNRITILAPPGGTTVLGWNWPLKAESGMTVVRRRAGSDYTLQNGGDYRFPNGLGTDGGGTLELWAPTVAGDRYVLLGSTIEERISDFRPNEGFATAKQNADLDQVTRILQEHGRDIDRAWKSDFGLGGGQITRQPAGYAPLFDVFGNLSAGLNSADIAAAVAASALVAAMKAEILAAISLAASPTTIEVAVGGGTQSVFLGSTVTKAMVLSVTLDGIDMHRSGWNVVNGVLAPVGGTWLPGALEVRFGQSSNLLVLQATPSDGTVTNAKVAGNAAIAATKLDYASPAKPAVHRPVSDKLFETESLYDYGGRPSSVLGSPDNYQAYTDAITDIMSRPRGGTLHIPRGVWEASQQVVFPKVVGKNFGVRGDHGGTVIRVDGVPADTAAWWIGSGSAAGGCGFRAQDLLFFGASATTGRAFELVNANGAQLHNVWGHRMRDFMKMTASYAVHMVGGETLDIGGDTIFSTTACHNLIVDRHKSYNAGLAAAGRFLEIVNWTDNIVIQNSDFEYARQVLNLIGGGTSLKVDGCYVEWFETDPFGFGAPTYQAEITNSWIALGADFAFTNWKSGRFTGNRLLQQTVSFANNCQDVTSDVELFGDSSFTPCPANAVLAFLNGSSNGARPATYRKADGVVYLGGEVNIGVNGQTIFQLPKKYRPTNFPRLSAHNPDNQANVIVIVDGVDGNVVANAASGTKVSLDGLSFYVG
jgi:hypothetical protein